MKDLLNAGQVLGRSEMREIMAGSGHDGGGSGAGACGYCTVVPCAWPNYTACCCSNGQKTCVPNDGGAFTMCDIRM